MDNPISILFYLKRVKVNAQVENQTYEYEVNENDICNFNIIEPVVESKDISE